MFCNRTHCALILMVTLAQLYGVEDIEFQAVARQHHLPIATFQGVVKRLVESNFVVIKGDNKVALKLAPEKITIWQVVACISNKYLLKSTSCSSPKNRTSTAIMIRKEDETLQKIISSRLKRYKLSEWSTKARKTVYI